MYMQSNQPYGRQTEDNNSFNWGKAGGAFAIGAAGNFAQDVVLNQITKRTQHSKNKTVASLSRGYQNLMASEIKGKFTDNVGVQKILGEKALNHKVIKNTLGRIPNMVPGTTSGKVMGYGVIPLAGAIFAGLTGETTAEAATKTLTGVPHKKEELR